MTRPRPAKALLAKAADSLTKELTARYLAKRDLINAKAAAARSIKPRRYIQDGRTTPEGVKFTFRTTKPVHDALKALAKAEGTSVNEIINRLLGAVL